MTRTEMQHGLGDLTTVSWTMSEAECRKRVQKAFPCKGSQQSDLWQALVGLDIVQVSYVDGDSQYRINWIAAGSAHSLLGLLDD